LAGWFILPIVENGIQGKCWKLLRSLYSNIGNKVLFGDFKSGWFDQEFGLNKDMFCSEPSSLF